MVPRFAARQHGAIGLMATLTLGLALLFMLLAVDGGRLYLEQRKLQRIADMAALETAEHGGVCTGSGPQATALARTAATRNGHAASNPLVASCGYLQTGVGSVRSFVNDNTRPETIRVEVSNTVTTSVAGGLFTLVEGNFARTTTLHARAVAAKPLPPQAMLSLRTTLATVSSSQGPLQSGLVNALGGNLQLDLLGWQGIANTQLNLLDYLNQLALDLNLSAGNYRQALAFETSAGKLLQAAAKVLQRGGATADVLTNLAKIGAQLPAIDNLQLGDLLDVQTGAVQSGLNTNLQLLQLVQGVIQLAAKEHGASVDLPINLLGLANGKVQLRVIEPQQISAVGDPRTDDLRVHTAQIRALISLDLPRLTGVAGLTNAVLDLAAPLTNVLNNVLGLNLMGTVQSLTCALGVPCKVSDIKLLDEVTHIDIGLEVAEATSRLRPMPPDAYSCSPKTLTTVTQRSAAAISVGSFGANASKFLTDGSASTPVQALRLIDIGTNVCSRLLILPPSCGTRVPGVGGGLGLRVNTKVLASSPAEKPLVFNNPPNIGLAPAYQNLDTDQSQVVTSLADTLAGIHLEAYRPTTNNGLGLVMNVTAGLLDGVRALIDPLICNLLGPLLDPVVNSLLKGLGVDLATGQVGANLSCSSGHAQLVL
ncbi:pilus assembly protein TadG-related protein [Pseudomonas sp. NY15463]|uniref:pilus assembly protein TadG-related protein n=1 Tax=Pseudomonas sp. NY15463 TaxID=3400361 RepID=UPI003A83E815